MATIGSVYKTRDTIILILQIAIYPGLMKNFNVMTVATHGGPPGGRAACSKTYILAKCILQ